MKSMLLCASVSAVAVLGLAASANAVGVIANGAYAVGIGNNGELYDFTTGVGFLRLADGYDPLAPGNPRDSWGVETSLGSAYADQAYFGQQNIAGTGFVFAANSANAHTVTNVGVDVIQQYEFAAPNILQIDETITNTSPYFLSGTVFQRDVDWDVAPTEFNENSVGPFGASAIVNDSSYDGFENPDPSVPYAFSCFLGCNVIGDWGGGINVDVAPLAPGASDHFSYFYEINKPGQTLNGLVAQAFGVGADYIIGTQSSEAGPYPALGYNSAIIGVGYSVPEPAAWTLMLVGFGGLGLALRGSRQRMSAVAA